MSKNIYDRDKVTPENWAELAEKQLRGKPLDGLTWETPEDIEVKPLYAGHVPLYPRPPGDDVRRPAVDDSPVCRFLHC
jgi:hypothetical protein